VADRWRTWGRDPGESSAAHDRLIATAGGDLTDLARRLTDSFLGRCVRRFMVMTGIDRSMVLASQAFTSLIPLLILVATWAPAGEEDVISEGIIRKFHLEGDAASAVTQLFAVPESATGAVSGFSALLLLISGTSFTRRFQRMYRAAYEQEKAGFRSGVYSTLGLVVMLVEVFVLYGVRALVAYLPFSWLFSVPLAVITGAMLWTSIPYLLLNRGVHWRRLVFGGVVASIATAAYSIASTVYMPQTLERYTQEFGLFGVTIALIGWLLAIAFILVAAAAVGAQFDVCLAPWALYLKTRFKLEDPDLLRPEPTQADLDSGMTTDDFRLVIRVVGSWGILTAAVWAATMVVPGIDVPGGFWAYVGVSLLLGLVSALLGAVPRILPVPQPVLVVAALSLVVNGLLLVIVAWVAPGLEIASFWAAMAGGFVIAVVTAVLEVVWKPIKRHL
jgi:membrane protein